MSAPPHCHEDRRAGDLHARAATRAAVPPSPASDTHFQTLAETVPDVIARFDRELRHLYVNPAGAQAAGQTVEEMIGRTNADLGMPPALVDFWAEKTRAVFAT